ncbi:hypothetical protein AB0I85_22555 [Micromonospora echinofusca]|uniref:hypothetical protein n=1 Tax=Micromonospora echinofusca TaxID=47858 RepID=UPI0033D2BBD7
MGVRRTTVLTQEADEKGWLIDAPPGDRTRVISQCGRSTTYCHNEGRSGLRRTVVLVSGVELIVAALAAGAGAGVSNTASAAIQDSYTQLKAVLVGRLQDRRQARDALDQDLTEPTAWEAVLGTDLRAAGAANDEQAIALARRILELIDRQGSRIDLRHSRGVQVGNDNVQTNTFH